MIGLSLKDQIKRHSVSLVVVVAFVAAGLGISCIRVSTTSAPMTITANLFSRYSKPYVIDPSNYAQPQLRVPNLDDPALILKGAGQYAAMCTQCHLAPGIDNSEVRVGMHPEPPDLSQDRIDPRAAFWVIKTASK